jgi:hypothetical protein
MPLCHHDGVMAFRENSRNRSGVILSKERVFLVLNHCGNVMSIKE